MLQRLIITVVTITAFSVSFGSRDVSAAGYGGGGDLGGAGHLGSNEHAGSAWHGGGGFSGWHGVRPWHGGRGWRGAKIGWGFYDPFIGYPFFGYPYAESPYILQCFRRIRVETLYGVSWQRVWVCN
jgi:hypothetical protein